MTILESNYNASKHRFTAMSKEKILAECKKKVKSVIILDFGKTLVGLEPTAVEGRWEVVVTDGESESRGYIAYSKANQEYRFYSNNTYCLSDRILKRILSNKYIGLGIELGYTIPVLN